MLGRSCGVLGEYEKALWLAGTMAQEAGDFTTVLELWERLAASAPEGSDLAQAMDRNIAEVRALVRSREFARKTAALTREKQLRTTAPLP